MSSLPYLLSSSPEQVAADHIGETIREVSRTLPEVVGFTRMPSGVWAGAPVIREASPDGNIRIYDPNDLDGNFAQFEKYDRVAGLYLGANLPQTEAAVGKLANWAMIQYGNLGNITTVGLSDIETAQSYERKVAVATGMQDLVRFRTRMV